MKKSEIFFKYSKIEKFQKEISESKTHFEADVFDINNDLHIGRIKFQICPKDQAIPPGEFIPEYLLEIDDSFYPRRYLKPHLYLKIIVFHKSQRGQGYLRKVFKELIKISMNNNAEGRIILESESLEGRKKELHQIYYALGMQHGPLVEKFLQERLEANGINDDKVHIGSDGKLQYGGDMSVILCLKPDMINKFVE